MVVCVPFPFKGLEFVPFWVRLLLAGAVLAV